MLELISGSTGAFLMGLFSTVHCVGMCGGIMGVLALNVPQGVNADWKQRFPYLLAYNMGRILTYGMIGGIAAGAAHTVINAVSPNYGHTALVGLTALLMVAMGLYLTGIFPGFAKIEVLGKPVWRLLEPFGRKFLPPRSPLHALLLGSIWGWLPCGMVYALLVLAAASGDFRAGAVYMVSFGLGTLPGVLSAGLAVGMASRSLQGVRLRRVAGVGMIVLAVVTLVFPVLYTGHSAHQGHQSPVNTGHEHHSH